MTNTKGKTTTNEGLLDEFRNYLQIDRGDLDTALTQQPRLFDEVGDHHAEALSKRDTLKEQLETIDAELAVRLRILIEKSGERATDARVASMVQQHNDHSTAYDKYLQAKLLADKWYTLREAFQMRSNMLRELCTLFTANYFAVDSFRNSASVANTVYETRKPKITEARTRIKGEK